MAHTVWHQQLALLVSGLQTLCDFNMKWPVNGDS